MTEKCSNNTEEFKDGSGSFLNLKSSTRYKQLYRRFKIWQTNKNHDSFSEDVLLEYFEEIIKVYDNIDIKSYSRVLDFIRSRCDNPALDNTSNSFTWDQMNEFFNKAPDHKYLAIKVAVIMAVISSCKIYDMHEMKIQDFKDLGTKAEIFFPKLKKKMGQSFTVTGNYYRLCKKYIRSRPPDTKLPMFFLVYLNGKCIERNIGMIKLGKMPRQIANFLNLENAGYYTIYSLYRFAHALAGTSRVNDEGHVIQLGTDGDRKPASAEDLMSKWKDICAEFKNCSNITINFVNQERTLRF